jgi:hypothetical protein
MTEEQSLECVASALSDACATLRLETLASSVADRVEHYGIEALIECTLAAQRGCVDATVRARFYTVAFDGVSRRIADELSATALCA